MKKIISFIVLAIFIVACTDNFESMNLNPTRISPKSLEQEFNHIGTVFPTMFSGLHAEQRFESLLYESFLTQITTNTDFMGTRNNTTYFVTWNTLWGQIYNSLMNPSLIVLRESDEGGYVVFSALIRLLRVVGLSKATSFYGPIVNKNYGSTSSVIYYDSEPEVYNSFFKTLDETMKIFAENKDFKGLAKFDATYKGDLDKWMKFINSFRIRLAMRIVKADPELAEKEFDKAMKDPAGIILDNKDNFNVSLYGAKAHIAVVFFEWTDARMGAGYEEVLVGYKDPRLSKFFAPVTGGPEIYADHPEYPYKGIASGSFIDSKTHRQPWSTVPYDYFMNITFQRHMTAQEIHFCLAEAALRGWKTPKSAQAHYEDGVKSSFEDWGAGGADTYLADNASLPLKNYVDPLQPKNNYTSRMQDPEAYTIKWRDDVSDEKKLERIMTQKWIASFNNSMEMWADHRRTGYPKVHLARQNNSSEQWGIISNDEPYPFPKRWPFVTAERNNNPVAVEDASIKYLGGKDKDLISTPLWIHPDPGGPNFKP